MLFKLKRFVTFIILCSISVDGANILAINALLSHSHHLFNDAYLFALAQKGHNVTLLGHDEDKHAHPNYTHIVMEGVYKELKKNLDLIKMEGISEWGTIQFRWFYTELTCLLDFKTEGLRKLTTYPNDFKFDLIVWDINNGQCLLPLIEKFGRPPIIFINPFINQPNIFKNVWQSHIPFMGHSFVHPMTLWQKLKTTFYNVLMEIIRITQSLPRQKELAESYFGKFNLSIEEFERSVTLMLTNYNPIFNYAEALPSNIIPVGGLHIQPKPLPEDFKRILDHSKHGVILFCLGSNVQSRDLGSDKIQSIIKTFSRLKQDVIWKFENDSLEGISKNVFIRKWVPQNDILGHKNTVLFITHAGLLSSHEIFYNGVPAIGIPFFLDQLQNIGTIVAKGVGEKLEFDEITESNLFNLIQKVLNNKSYTQNVKRLSRLYKYHMNNPLETAVTWTEYILEFKSAEHLNLPTRDMNLIEIANVDLILIFLVPFLFLFTFISCCFYYVVKRFTKLHKREKIKSS